MVGAPLANTNAMTHAGYARIPLTGLGSKHEAIRKRIERFRRALEAAARNIPGIAPEDKGKWINSACRHETIAVRWEYRLQQENVSDELLAAATDRISRETDRRDVCIDKLQLSRDQISDVWDVLSRPAPAPHCPADAADASPADPEAINPARNASDAKPGAHVANLGPSVNGGQL